jgi:ribosomal protein S18 acetylase RimI-like enzyme
MLHSFPTTAAGDGAPESDPVLRPYAELEDPGSLYISGVAICDGWRRQGIGTVLLEVATGRAAARALPRVSLICFAANEGAMRLYRRLGFREIDRRPIHPHPMLHCGAGDAVLLARPVDGGIANESRRDPCPSAA